MKDCEPRRSKGKPFAERIIHMKKMFSTAMLAAMFSLGACAYGGVAASGDTVVITRNDQLLFGLLRKVFVCKITPTGVSQCSVAEIP